MACRKVNKEKYKTAKTTRKILGITPEEALSLYSRVMEASGGDKGILNLDALISILKKPFSTFEGKELYPTLAEKASVIFEGIARFHPFLNGNKRMAYELADIFLRKNGYYISAKSGEIFNLLNEVAEGKKNLKDISKWIGSHIRKYY